MSGLLCNSGRGAGLVGLELLVGEAVGVVWGEAERAGIAEMAFELVLVPLGEGLDGELGRIGAPDGSLGVRSHREFRMMVSGLERYST